MTLKKDKLEKSVEFSAAFDLRASDPEKNYGIGCVRCWMILKGPKGAVQFVFSTGMYLPETHKEWLSKFEHDDKPYMGFDVGYHSPTPIYKGQRINKGKCPILGKSCYYDGSASRSDEWMDILVREGSDSIWKMLKKEYKERFE